MKLLVVESPNKARKLWSFLKRLTTDDWQVSATCGHFVDLPRRNMGIDPKTLGASYVFTNKKAWNSLLATARQAEEVYLGTDPDREGEAIAWFALVMLQGSGVSVPIFRARFQAITPSIVLEAIKSHDSVDLSLVESQVARRSLDRLVGYSLSRPLCRSLGSGRLSVGRVQSYALHLVATRTREIEDFKSVEHWRCLAGLKAKVGLAGPWYEEEAFVTDHHAAIDADNKGERFGLALTQGENPLSRNPAPPFTTAAMLQTACHVLRVDSGKVMSAAQSLFENGLITYHRTDSVSITPGAAKELHQLAQKFGVARPSMVVIPLKGAHEGIRPTHPSEHTPSNVQSRGLPKKLYGLIWARAVAFQCIPLEVLTQKLSLVDSEGTYPELVTHGGKVTEVGWAKIAKVCSLPYPAYTDLSAYTTSTVASTSIDHGWTPPLRHYSQTTLIGDLERNGVGRPSTYASIIGVLLARKYVRAAGNVLVATTRGCMVNHQLTRCLPDLVSAEFTATMEGDLDRIADDSLVCAHTIVGRYHAWVAEASDAFTKPTPPVCPECKEPLSLIVPFKGTEPFAKCDPCNIFYSIKTGRNRILRFKAKQVPHTSCKSCKKPLTHTSGKYGKYFLCKGCGSTQTVA